MKHTFFQTVPRHRQGDAGGLGGFASKPGNQRCGLWSELRTSVVSLLGGGGGEINGRGRPVAPALRLNGPVNQLAARRDSAILIPVAGLRPSLRRNA
jgi:hypothetical protein